MQQVKKIKLLAGNSIRKSDIQLINHPFFAKKNIKLFIKRDDLLHPILSGNKWRKLKYQLLHVLERNYTGVVSFGGAFSNHIHALAGAGHTYNIPTAGIIRGDSHALKNPTLTRAAELGMELHLVSREEYKQRNTFEYSKLLAERFPGFYQCPEGGSAPLALPGVVEIIDEVVTDEALHGTFSTIVAPVGSGGTLAGLIAGLQKHSKLSNTPTNVLGVAVLKGESYLEKLVTEQLINAKFINTSNWEISHNYTFGGYGRFNDKLVNFCQSFYQYTGIKSDPIYSGKMLYAIFDLIEKDFFKPGSNILAIHTGGLQGIDGLKYMNRLPEFWPD